MNTNPTPPNRPTVIPLHAQAEANLAYIRSTMEAAALFSGISGKGLVLVGLSALLCTWGTQVMATGEPLLWVMLWLLEAVFAASIALFCMQLKTRALGQTLWSASGKKLFFALAPAFGVGAILTLLLVPTPYTFLLPPLWLLLYGAGVTTAGAHSIVLVPVMGIAFMVAGTLAGVNALWGSWQSWPFMAAGFGGLHILFGSIIWRRHGG